MALSDSSQVPDGYREAFVPVWTATGTAPSLGNGTLTADTFVVGRLQMVRYEFNAGSTTTFGTGAWSFSFPLAASGNVSMGHAEFEDNSSGQIYVGNTRWASTLTVSFIAIALANPGTFATNASPFTWAVSDKIRASIWMELA